MDWSYRDRTHAGEVLAEELKTVQVKKGALVLAIPNGGVAVALPIAQALNADVDVIIVRKLQIPSNPEAGFGALTSLGSLILNDSLVKQIGLTEDDVRLVRLRTQKQIEDRKEAYRGMAGLFHPGGRDVILVDDGLASGYTMLAAIHSVREARPSSMTVAVPTSSASAAQKVEVEVDRLVCPRVEAGFAFAVANAYENWYDAPDSEVIAALAHVRDEI